MKPYRIIGAYDSETTNYIVEGQNVAFPILHQLGLLNGPLQCVTPENVEDMTDVTMYRHAVDLYSALDDLLNAQRDFVPVIVCHNLSFDMYGLSSWLNRHDVRVLAKSARKPITFTVKADDGETGLVIWDTLIFSQQSLERMGTDCQYAKGVGEWDYNAIRTPETPLTPDEIDYAKRDIYTLLCWLSWWLNRNPDIKPERLALNVVTKTGVVRERRRVRFDQVKGKGLKYNVGRYWLYRCRMEQPKSDDELYTMFACTRGGFTFCSSKNASIPFDLVGSDEIVAAYDATSMHPAQIVSHVYPIGFKEQEPYILDLAFNLISKVTVKRVLNRWEKPFPVAFNACFEFTNLRPKKGSYFEKFGVMPLASARYKAPDQTTKYDDDNGDNVKFLTSLHERNYKDTASNAVFAFGKVVSAEKIRLYITELTAFEICLSYEWDSVRAIHGYSTGRFVKPSDMDVISVMQFYKAKDTFKHARELYYQTGIIDCYDDLVNLGIAPMTAQAMKDGTISDTDVEATYLSLKADLNAIFGISCSNQYRRKTVLAPSGIEYQGEFGLCNAPKNPKVWYQFGQRIVGWSRIAQMCAIHLIMPHAQTLINGDTDSLKVKCKRDKLSDIAKALEVLGQSIDNGKKLVCARIKRSYPELYNELDGIGHYAHEFSSERFCASWNKAYCMQDIDKRDGKRHFAFTLAGVPTRRKSGNFSSFIGVNGLADRLYALGWSFGAICDLFLGYNVTFAYDVIKLNARSFPNWGDNVVLRVTDRDGMSVRVVEPAALAIYPMSKTLNDTSTPDNANNVIYAKRNRASVNTSRAFIYAHGVTRIDLSEVFGNA